MKLPRVLPHPTLSAFHVVECSQIYNGKGAITACNFVSDFRDADKGRGNAAGSLPVK